MKEIQWRIEEAKRKAKDWWEENQITVMVLGPTILGAAIKIGSIFSKHAKIRKEEVLRDKMVWDPQVGHYWRLKRRLDKSEWLWISRQHKAGRMIGELLDELGVLK